MIEKSQTAGTKMPRTLAQLEKVKKQIVKKYLQTNDRIVFVGMTATIPSPTHVFFIKITDFAAVYKRLLMRELEKITANTEKIKRHIREESDPREIDVQRIADLSLVFPVDYKAFLEDYRERLAEARRKKYLVKTQEEILAMVNAL